MKKIDRDANRALAGDVGHPVLGGLRGCLPEEGSQRHRGGALAFAVLGPAVLIQAISAAAVYVAGVPTGRVRVSYKLFFYDSVAGVRSRD